MKTAVASFSLVEAVSEQPCALVVARRKKQQVDKQKKKKEGGAPVQPGVQCKICLTTIANLGTAVNKLDEHHGSKHSKKTVVECFPDYEKIKAEGAAKEIKLKALDDKKKKKEAAKHLKPEKKKGKKKKGDLSDLEAAMAGLK